MATKASKTATTTPEAVPAPIGNPVLFIDPTVIVPTPTDAATTVATTTATSDEPGYAALTVDLANADREARGISADAAEARNKRSTVAVDTLKAAFREKVAPDDVRTDLLGTGVLKGTVSKITTVLQALNDGILATSDVKSLNGAYALVKEHAKAVAAGATPGTTGSAGPMAPPLAPTIVKGAQTPEEALALIIKVVTSEKDPDKAFALAGEWITKITQEISKAVTAMEDEEGEGE
jgi:hypothetical protein